MRKAGPHDRVHLSETDRTRDDRVGCSFGGRPANAMAQLDTFREKAGERNGRRGSVRVGCLLPAALRHRDGAATAGLIMGSPVRFSEACFAPPSGCTWMYTLGLRGSRTAQRNGRRGAQCAPAGARCRKQTPHPDAANHRPKRRYLLFVPVHVDIEVNGPSACAPRP